MYQSLFLCVFFLNGLKLSNDLTSDLVLDAQASLGEGALWHPDEDKLYWVDIEGGFRYFWKISFENGSIVTESYRSRTQCFFLCIWRKGLDILYITTARAWVNEEKLKQFPLSGGLFAVKPGVKGVRAQFYKGKL